MTSLDAWRTAATVLEGNEGILADLLALVGRHHVKGKKIHDANVVATMLTKGISRLATLNVDDFKRYEHEIRISTLAA